MPNSQRTLIAVLLDRSGSMEAIKSDTEAGFDALIAEQAAEPGEASYPTRQRRRSPGSAAPGFADDDRVAAKGTRR